MLLLFAASAALAADPSPSSAALSAAALSSAEWAQLREGEVVVHADTSGADTVSTGWVLVDKASAPFWHDVLDLKARIPENGTLRDIEEYKRLSAHEWFVRVDMEVFGLDVQFTNHWICAGDTCSYTLDPERENDLTRCDGYFRVQEVEGQSLLTYYSASRHRVVVPGWARRWLAIDAVQNLLRKLKARAERG
jgi:hypothetical protein